MKRFKKKNALFVALAAILCSCNSSLNSALDSFTEDVRSTKYEDGITRDALFDKPYSLQNGSILRVYGISFRDGFLKLSVHFTKTTDCKATNFSAYLELEGAKKGGLAFHTLEGAEGVIKLPLATELDEDWATNLENVNMDFLFKIPEDCISIIQNEYNKDKYVDYYLATDFGLGPRDYWDDTDEDSIAAIYKSFYQDIDANYLLADMKGEELPYEFKSDYSIVTY